MIYYRINEDINKTAKIDTRDEKVLSILSENSRTAISAISRKIRLSKEGTFYRLKRFKDKNIILKFYPLFDVKDFGYTTYHVFMVINESKPENKSDLIDHLTKHPNTKAVMEYSDRWDIEWTLIAKDVQDFDNIITDLTKKFKDIIIEKNKFEIILGYKSSQFPDIYNKNTNVFQAKKKVEKKIDKTSMRILRLLCDDCRQSTYKIGEKVGLSPDAVSYRIRNMVKSNIISQFSIMPNLSLLGYHWQTMCINLRTFELNHEMKFKEYISQKPEIIRAVKILGDWDLMLTIVTKKIGELHQIVKDIHQNFVEVIITYQTWLGYKEHFYTSFPKIIK